MSIYEESISALPERLETSDYNWSGIAMLQGNGAVQLAGISLGGQLALQSNHAGAVVTQVNL